MGERNKPCLHIPKWKLCFLHIIMLWQVSCSAVFTSTRWHEFLNEIWIRNNIAIDLGDSVCEGSTHGEKVGVVCENGVFFMTVIYFI